MIYLGDTKLDLRNQELIEFIQDGVVGSIWQWPLAEILDYQQSAIEEFDIGVAMSGVDIPWTVVQYWSLADQKQEISQFKIETTAYKIIKINASIRLYTKNGLPLDLQNRIENAFKTYSLALGDVDTYAESFLKANLDISPFSFGCARSYTVEILTDEVFDESKISFLRRRLGERYRVRQIGENQLKKGEYRLVRGPNEISCPHDEDDQIDPGHPCDPLKDIEEIAKSRLDGTSCVESHTTVWQIARTDYFPDSRWVWAWHTIRIGCTSFDLYYPQTELRDRELQFFASITVPESLIRYEQSIRDCAQNSAVATVVLTIIFSDYPTAAAKFTALFWACLKAKFTDALECVTGEVWVDTVYTGNWH